MNETTKAYIAGILDGEGSIGIYIARSGNGYGSHYMKVTVKMSEPQAVNLIAQSYDGKIHVQAVRGNSRPCGTVVLGANRGLKILEDCLPYMLVKKVQAEVAIAFQKAKTNWITHNRKVVVGRERLSEEEWNLREEFRLKMYAMNSGRLGFKPKLQVAATTEWEGRLPKKA